MLYWEISGSGGCIVEQCETVEQGFEALRALIARGTEGGEGDDAWYIDPQTAAVREYVWGSSRPVREYYLIARDTSESDEY